MTTFILQTYKYSSIKAAFIAFLVFGYCVSPATAAPDSTAGSVNIDPQCKSNDIISSKLFTDICWECLFPIKVAGIPLGGGKAPSNASNKVFCSCSDGLGIYHPGIVNSLWQPQRVIELTRTPGCLSSLGGAKLNLGSNYMYGSQIDYMSGAAGTETKGTSFYEAHLYALPLLEILDLFLPADCDVSGYVDFDIISFTEIDPTWNNEELAFFQAPESAAVANIVAETACSVDAVSQFAGNMPTESLWWCAGSWGSMYPLAGFRQAMDPSRTTSLLASKILAQQHRRGLAYSTVGDENLCRGSIYPTIPKQQYKMTMFYPTPETKRGHMIGDHPYKWQGGSTRYPIGQGSDTTYMIWTWIDCCRRF